MCQVCWCKCRVRGAECCFLFVHLIKMQITGVKPWACDTSLGPSVRLITAVTQLRMSAGGVLDPAQNPPSPLGTGRQRLRSVADDWTLPLLLQVYWRVPEEKQRECTYKGKQAEVGLSRRPALHKTAWGGRRRLPRAVYLHLCQSLKWESLRRIPFEVLRWQL